MGTAGFAYSERRELSDAARDTYLAFAIELAMGAGKAILPYFRPDALEVENKGSAAYDPVTQADRLAEQVMREMIGEHFPAHGVLGEEFDHTPGDGLTWVLDPIDGTRAFVMGLLHWGTLVALFDGQRPIIGVLHQPFTQETFAGDGTRAFRRQGMHEQILRTRSCDAVGKALGASTAPDMFVTDLERDGFGTIRGLVRDMRYGTDCYAYAMLAHGHIDLVLEAGLKPYDVQALIPIVEGAGGVLTDWRGENAAMGGAVLACGDPELHELVLQELQS